MDAAKVSVLNCDFGQTELTETIVGCTGSDVTVSGCYIQGIQVSTNKNRCFFLILHTCSFTFSFSNEEVVIFATSSPYKFFALFPVKSIYMMNGIAKSLIYW